MIDKNLIVMLTWHDVTVANAKELFLECRGAAATHWGFKIEGTTPESMAELIGLMKQAGKRTYIEVLAIDEPTCLKSAQLCAHSTNQLNVMIDRFVRNTEARDHITYNAAHLFCFLKYSNLHAAFCKKVCSCQTSRTAAYYSCLLIRSNCRCF